MERRNGNNAFPACLLAAVVAAGMTAYADDCDRPLVRAKPAPTPVATENDGDAPIDSNPPPP